MNIDSIIEFTAKASIRTLVYVYNDEDKLVKPTSLLVTLIDADGLRRSKATATTASHLIDTTKNQFTANDVGKTVYNSTDETTAKITAYNSPSDVTLDTNIMADGENYEIYCVYEVNIVSDGEIEDGIYEHFYNTTKGSAKGWWQEVIEVVDGTAPTARTSIGDHSIRVK